MSKSLGNFFTVRDLLDKGVPGEVIRLVFLGTHYSKPMDWTAEKAAQAEAALRKWRGLVTGIEPAQSPLPAVISALSDDLNTSAAVAELHAAAARGDYAGLLASAQFLGVLGADQGAWAATVDLSPWAAQLAQLRQMAVATKDFAAVDALKAVLVAAGVDVRMSKAGIDLVPSVRFDAAKLGALG